MLKTLIGNKKINKGISIVEILVAITIISIVFIALFGVATFYLKVSFLTKKTVQASRLIEESIEVVKNFRDGTDWDTNGIGILDTGDSNPYYPELDNGTNPPHWILTEGVETINNFTREIVFENVSRDLANNIEDVYDISRDDPNTKKLIVTVSWDDKDIEVITYITNWRN
ncbi:MAG: prepilin-type N-terminal cleavage/methylation domain-containing protein [Patescibacteria group bacterium]